jgi:hypothetical protein
MNSYQYDSPLTRGYRVAAAAVDTAGVLLTVHGPKGKKGRVAAVSARVTVALTVADTLLTVRPKGGSATVSVTLPFTGSAADDVEGKSAEELKGQVELPADTPIEIVTDGGSTAGDADVEVDIDWY